MNKRVQGLLERLRSKEHIRYRVFLDESMSCADEGRSLIERKAQAIRLIVDSMPVFILEGEVLVGSKTVYGRIPGVDPEDRHRIDPLCFPHYATQEEKARLGGEEGKQKNHALPDYIRPLALGLDGMRGEIERRKQRSGMTEAQTNFLNAALISLDCVSALAERYAALAERTAASPEALVPQDRAAELCEIARVCKKIAREKPDTLHEAMQLYLFIYFVLLIEQGASVGFGRVDQLFWPFVNRAGAFSATELIDCFLIKLNDISDIDTGGDTAYDGQDSIVLCGVKPDGTDATNALSSAFLNELRSLHVPSPVPCVRVAESTPQEILTLCCELNLNRMNGAALYNDEAFIPALTKAGFPLADARDYGIDLCQDIQLAGATDLYMGAQFNAYEPVCAALYTCTDDASWEEFYARAKALLKRDIDAQLSELIEFEACAYDFPDDPAAFERAFADKRLRRPYRSYYAQSTHMLSPYPVYSTFLKGCIENARDVTNGGCRYRSKGTIFLVPTTAVNSLAAIKHCAFDEHTLTLSQIRMGMEANWQGFEDVRLKLLSAPKWGNDDDRCDLLAKDYLEFGLREAAGFVLKNGDPLPTGLHQPHTMAAGKNYRATPDGRFDFEPVPVTISPTNGTDINGPTAVLNSAAKLDSALLQWNNALTLAFEAPADASDVREKATILSALIRGYFDKGGTQLQINVLSLAEMLDAQAHPDRHRDLLVRVWGVSMAFVNMSVEWQNEIIARVRHSL